MHATRLLPLHCVTWCLCLVAALIRFSSQSTVMCSAADATRAGSWVSAARATAAHPHSCKRFEAGPLLLPLQPKNFQFSSAAIALCAAAALTTWDNSDFTPTLNPATVPFLSNCPSPLNTLWQHKAACLQSPHPSAFSCGALKTAVLPACSTNSVSPLPPRLPSCRATSIASRNAPSSPCTAVDAIVSL
jgi:hypothetical protein